jgi:hypothetical protein
MSESEKNSWDRERVTELIIQAGKDANLTPLDIAGLVPLAGKMVELLGSVRVEAIGWVWSEACSQHAKGLDPRKFEVPLLMDRANADLNPERDE